MALHIGVAQITLHLPGNTSLKGKRAVVKSVVERVRNRFNVSVAEVDTQDVLQTATIGLVCVSGDGQHADAMLTKIVDYVERERLDAEVTDVNVEIIAW